jgi:hypothetical protein
MIGPQESPASFNGPIDVLIGSNCFHRALVANTSCSAPG